MSAMLHRSPSAVLESGVGEPSEVFPCVRHEVCDSRYLQDVSNEEEDNADTTDTKAQLKTLEGLELEIRTVAVSWRDAVFIRRFYHDGCLLPVADGASDGNQREFRLRRALITDTRFSTANSAGAEEDEERQHKHLTFAQRAPRLDEQPG